MATGDEWKGESESEGSYFSLFGKPLTTEQREEWTRKCAEIKAKADMLGMLLPPLNLTRSCPKCGHPKVKVMYCAGSESYHGADCYPQTGHYEHMHRSCKRCFYIWHEKPLGEVGL